ncbi:lysophospholipid acyltransferase family protein [Geoalkalibacter sp.]|uniref:lysophospholipid acyltransferase family protein n=1 Tax=Geoalkalibacter sp. TaxID=3041440 RepID=UPI00272DCCED|nr:GNAT family N-acyltransferase [Geoalkalibacter sp.]
MPQEPTPDQIFRLQPFHGPLKRKLFNPIGRGVEHLLSLAECRRLYAGMPTRSAHNFCGEVLNLLGISAKAGAEDLGRVPASGPLLVVANHPFGAADGLILLHLLEQIRPDTRVMANSLLARIPEMRDRLISVDPFAGEGSARANIAPLRACLRWLRQGGAVILFPAGEVSHVRLRDRGITDPPWSTTLGRLVKQTSATVLPVYFPGGNSLLFQGLGLLHKRVRTALLPHELLNKRRQNIEVRIGAPIPFRRLAHRTDTEITDYLRTRTYLLEQRRPQDPGHEPKKAGIFAPLIPEVCPDSLQEEIDRLPRAQRLAENGPYEVWQARAGQIPCLLQEIGRLRELTFRGVGEGTGRALDLDRFDKFYSHLFLWNGQTRELVGAYRLGRSDHLLAEQGLAGLYTRTLFHYERSFLDQLGPALELGRSFVRPEYQKSYQPLMLLWKGIGRFVTEHPQYAVLFGPVSISSDYAPASRRLMAASLSRSCTLPELSRLVKARRPLRLKHTRLPGCPNQATRELLANFDEIASVVADLEPEGRGVPVLLRQYLNLGGKILSFSLDEDFGDVLDGLILVDLRQTEMKTLERYCGREGAARFLAYHQTTQIAEGF